CRALWVPPPPAAPWPCAPVRESGSWGPAASAVCTAASPRASISPVTSRSWPAPRQSWSAQGPSRSWMWPPPPSCWRPLACRCSAGRPAHCRCSTAPAAARRFPPPCRTPPRWLASPRPHWQLSPGSGLLLARPPAGGLDLAEVITAAVGRVHRAGVSGQAVTPAVLTMIEELSGGRSVAVNQELIADNAALAAQVAVAYAAGAWAAECGVSRRGTGAGSRVNTGPVNAVLKAK